MNCERVRALIDAYTTDELDLAAALDVEEHLDECAVCAGELESFHALRRAVAGPSLRYAAPPELRRRISAELERVDSAGESTARARVTRPGPGRRLGLAAAIGALLLLPWIGMYWNASRSSTNQLAAEITSSHIRSLITDHLLDVASTDRHTVKPWFNGRLDFSPTVIDLTAEGFPLIGGRLDYIDNRPVAAIVYRRDKHVINLYNWPAPPADAQPSASHHNGYHVLRWTDNGMICVAVSDLSPQGLRQFADLLRREPTTRP